MSNGQGSKLPKKDQPIVGGSLFVVTLGRPPWRKAHPDVYVVMVPEGGAIQDPFEAAGIDVNTPWDWQEGPAALLEDTLGGAAEAVLKRISHGSTIYGDFEVIGFNEDDHIEALAVIRNRCFPQ